MYVAVYGFGWQVQVSDLGFHLCCLVHRFGFMGSVLGLGSYGSKCGSISFYPELLLIISISFEK